MIRLTTPLAHSEFANLVRMHELLEKSRHAELNDDEFDEYWQLFDRTISGVLSSSLIAAANYNTAMLAAQKGLEVAHG